MKKIVSLILVMMITMITLFAGGSTEVGTKIVNIIDDFGDTIGKGISFNSIDSDYDLYSGQDNGYNVTLTCFSDGVYVKVNYYNYDGSPIEANYTYYEAKIKTSNTTYTEKLYENNTMNEYGYSFINNPSLSDDIVNTIANGGTVKLSIKGDSYRKNVLLDFNLTTCAVTEIVEIIDWQNSVKEDITMDIINEYLNQ